jgi:hypothetical protein
LERENDVSVIFLKEIIMPTTSSSGVYALGRFVYDTFKMKMANSVTGASLTDEEMMKSPLDLGTAEDIWKQRFRNILAALYADKVHGTQLQRFKPDQQYEIKAYKIALDTTAYAIARSASMGSDTDSV